ncbi:hypothetical protein [Actinomadura chokoriensis]|uniref:hypothetical protein n=1 Tax=Actinomadura chokoriensis TaxID=454156 RepID=UPI0031F95C94
MSGQQAPDAAELVERLERAEARIERLSEILADVFGEALRESQRRRGRPHLRAVK